jgi:lysophospholipase L1-like esterase
MSIFQGLPAAGSQTVYAFSLFTNDDPRNTTALASAVRASAQRAATAGGCAIWATIARPPYGGVSYAGPNAVLRRLDSQLERVVLVDWAGAVAANPSWMSGDGVHGTPTGYRARAQMYADAARSCL